MVSSEHYFAPDRPSGDAAARAAAYNAEVMRERIFKLEQEVEKLKEALKVKDSK